MYILSDSFPNWNGAWHSNHHLVQSLWPEHGDGEVGWADRDALLLPGGVPLHQIQGVRITTFRIFELKIYFFRDFERNIELAQLVQQKLDAYKVKSRNKIWFSLDFFICRSLLPSSAKPQQQPQLPAAAKLQPYFAFHPPPPPPPRRANRFPTASRPSFQL